MSPVHLFSREELSAKTRTPFVERRLVRFQDVDAAGVVFYPRIFEYWNDAYLSLLAAANQPLPEVLRAGRWISPLRHAEAEFLAPLRFGEAIEVALVRAHLQASEVALGCRVARAESGQLAAIGQVVHVFVDPSTFRRTEIPDQLRRAFVALEAGASGA